MKALTIIVGVFASCILFLPNVANASTSLSVTPAIVERVLERGQAITVNLQLRNGSNVPLPVALYVEPSSEFQLLNPIERQRYDASQWVQFQEEVFLFEANQTRSISLTINAPENVQSGGHYARIILRALVLEQPDNSRQTVLPELNVPLLLTVAGDVDRSLSTITKKIFPWYSNKHTEINSIVAIRNTGNVHNLVTPVVVVMKDGQEVARFRAEPAIVLPELERNLELKIEPITTNGVYEIKYFEQANQENSNQIIRIERMIVGPPLSEIVGLALVTWFGLHAIQYRARVLIAIKILTGKV